MQYDAVVIGGGAAGLFCAIFAGRRGRRVLVVEHNAEVGRKILISGGGRCNFTNVHTRAENFISQNPHFCKSALAGYTPEMFLSLVKQHGIAYYEKTLGQLFCRQSSRLIIDMLLKECRAAGVEVKTACSVKSVAHNGDYVIQTDRGTLRAPVLVVAAGGLSFPKIGATDIGYRIARQFGSKIVETRPSLVGLVLAGANYKHLAGVSVDAVVKAGRQSFRENILFTHRGLSGPAILQISNYWRRGEPVEIDLLPGTDARELLSNGASSRQTAGNYISQYLPSRFARDLGERLGPDTQMAHLSQKQIESLGREINAWRVSFNETEGYDRAEVTLGGVSTDELSSKTMESKRAKGLYFIGEVVDVTGWLGGYNFQWAWSSAFAAANAI